MGLFFEFFPCAFSAQGFLFDWTSFIEGIQPESNVARDVHSQIGEEGEPTETHLHVEISDNRVEVVIVPEDIDEQFEEKEGFPDNFISQFLMPDKKKNRQEKNKVGKDLQEVKKIRDEGKGIIKKQHLIIQEHGRFGVEKEEGLPQNV